MSLINVTTWSARKRHLANPGDEKKRTYGSYLPTLCEADSVRPGDRWVMASANGPMTQQRIDAMAPCKRCEKRRSAAEGVQP